MRLILFVLQNSWIEAHYAFDFSIHLVKFSFLTNFKSNIRLRFYWINSKSTTKRCFEMLFPRRRSSIWKPFHTEATPIRTQHSIASLFPTKKNDFNGKRFLFILNFIYIRISLKLTSVSVKLALLIVQIVVHPLPSEEPRKKCYAQKKSHGRWKTGTVWLLNS